MSPLHSYCHAYFNVLPFSPYFFTLESFFHSRYEFVWTHSTSFNIAWFHQLSIVVHLSWLNLIFELEREREGVFKSWIAPFHLLTWRAELYYLCSTCINQCTHLHLWCEKILLQGCMIGFRQFENGALTFKVNRPNCAVMLLVCYI